MRVQAGLSTRVALIFATAALVSLSSGTTALVLWTGASHVTGPLGSLAPLPDVVGLDRLGQSVVRLPGVPAAPISLLLPRPTVPGPVTFVPAALRTVARGPVPTDAGRSVFGSVLAPGVLAIGSRAPAVRAPAVAAPEPAAPAVVAPALSDSLALLPALSVRTTINGPTASPQQAPVSSTPVQHRADKADKAKKAAKPAKARKSAPAGTSSKGGNDKV